MADIRHTLERGRLALHLVRTSVRDLDSPIPRLKQSAAAWLSARDEGFSSYLSQCEHLADYVRVMDPAIARGYEKSTHAREVGTLRNAEHWRSLIDSSLDAGMDARGALCGLLMDLYGPQTLDGPEATPLIVPDRNSRSSGSPGM